MDSVSATVQPKKSVPHVKRRRSPSGFSLLTYFVRKVISMYVYVWVWHECVFVEAACLLKSLSIRAIYYLWEKRVANKSSDFAPVISLYSFRSTLCLEVRFVTNAMEVATVIYVCEPKDDCDCILKWLFAREMWWIARYINQERYFIVNNLRSLIADWIAW